MKTVNIGRWAIGLAVALLAASPTLLGASPKKIVLIAGKKSHGPEGNRIHDYPWTVRLIKVMLDNSNVRGQVRVECHFDGWPKDPATLETADSIMVVSDGRDGDLYEDAPHISSAEHAAFIARQMARGCGLVTYHFSTFTPDAYGPQVLAWNGAYFDWETDGKRQWYSAIKSLEAEVHLRSPGHPVQRGVRPFRLREEFYHNLRFQPGDAALQPLLEVPALEGREPDGNLVAWARQRSDGGRGFGTSCGHSEDNWLNADYRKFILNGIVWSAGVEVPASGVEAGAYDQSEIRASLAGVAGSHPARYVAPIKALILTGRHHPGHDWRATTPVLQAGLEQDARFQVTISTHIEDLATLNLKSYGVLILNYCNWQQPQGLSRQAKQAFTQYLAQGGGLVIVHFANGAWHFSLPEAGASDWPEFRKICSRAWDHNGGSAHDAYGPFRVEITSVKHPATAGLQAFDTLDELYFNQRGEASIEPLATAVSKATGRAEPMAWAYAYGQGRIFQTLLGHGADSLKPAGVAQLIRQGAAWAAGRTSQPLAD